MDPAEAARALVRALGGKGRDFTIADASATSGLPLRDAERGLHRLVSEYRGHLRVTSDGDLLFRFPHGFRKPWVTKTRLQSLVGRVGAALAGALRFVVRAWIAIVIVAYAAAFVALAVALLFARSSGGDSRDDRASVWLHVLLRVVFDALFWTFHPFSPVSLAHGGAWGGAFSPAMRRRAPRGPKVPFYEKVNRFFFGPREAPPEPRALERAILAEIRAQKGRVGLADVMRVTGLPRDEADPLMARLMLDYDGAVEVSEAGGIVYRFSELRRTVADAADARPRPVWEKLRELPPLTGNERGANLLVGGLNALNLLMGLFAMQAGLTVSNAALLFQGVPLAELPPGGTAIALGVVPFVFSLVLFTLPLGRALLRPLESRRIARENARRLVLREVLAGARRGGVTPPELEGAWQKATGAPPAPKELTREVVALGGTVDLEADGVRYRFPDFEAEAEALRAEREAAAEEEARVGKIVFSSET